MPRASRLPRWRTSAAKRLAPWPPASPSAPRRPARCWRTVSGNAIIHRVWAWPILLGVLFAVYEFVGVFGAGILVGLMEKDLFGAVLNPAVTQFVQNHIGVPWLADLFVGPYGLWTMGVTYALALILPIVTTFFLAFGVMEDSGYLPRLAALSNRMFKALWAERQSRAADGARTGMRHHGYHHHPRPARPSASASWPPCCWRWRSPARLSWAS